MKKVNASILEGVVMKKVPDNTEKAKSHGQTDGLTNGPIGITCTRLKTDLNRKYLLDESDESGQTTSLNAEISSNISLNVAT